MTDLRCAIARLRTHGQTPIQPNPHSAAVHAPFSAAASAAVRFPRLADRRLACYARSEGRGADMKIDGACHCGRIRYEAEADPRRTVICHCTSCQTMSGAPYRVNVSVLARNF